MDGMDAMVNTGSRKRNSSHRSAGQTENEVAICRALKVLLLFSEVTCIAGWVVCCPSSAGSWAGQQRSPLAASFPGFERLNPEENPFANKSCISSSGVPYSRAFQYVHSLFPPSTLDERTANSRIDGYWPYLKQGQGPPKQFTYGEFDFYFFAEILDEALQFMSQSEFKESRETGPITFSDLGSGTGRLVFASAILHPGWKLCRGVEILPSIHSQAKDILSSNVIENDGDDAPRLATIEFQCGSFTSPYACYFGDSDIIFCFSSCLGPEVTAELAENIGRTCKPGTIVITTDFMLPLQGQCPSMENEDERIPTGPFQFMLLKKFDGYCWLTGGSSTAFIHRLVQVPETATSLPGPWEEPKLSIHEMAYQAYLVFESNDPTAFLNGVHNNVVFSGLPLRFSPLHSREQKANQ